MTLRRCLPLLALIAVTITLTACAEKADQITPAPIQALQERGIRIVDTFEAPGKLTGYAGIMGRRPVAIYLTQDGEHAIIGSMINGSGEFMNRDTVQQMVVDALH